MPFYTGLYDKSLSDAQRSRASTGLLKLKRQLEADVPRRTVGDALLLATWNIREFDSAKYGPRCPECYYYIAEIIDHFDLVAVQEVREDLAALRKLLSILGGWWKYVVTDVTEGTSGNGERLAFLYDERKVRFDGLAGEIVLPDVKGERALQFARSPFVCGFRSGWSAFHLCTVHIYYGKGVKDDPRRVKEIQDLARLLARRTQDQQRSVKGGTPVGEKVMRVRDGENLILLGDFNIFNREDVTMKALTDVGFDVPEELQALGGSNLGRNRHYDQIAFMTKPGRFGTTGRAGVFDFSKSVFGADAGDTYSDLFAANLTDGRDPKRYYADWRTHQMSDHLLMWVELKIDYSDDYLTRMARKQPDEGDVPLPPEGRENGAAANGQKRTRKRTPKVPSK